MWISSGLMGNKRRRWRGGGGRRLYAHKWLLREVEESGKEA